MVGWYTFMVNSSSWSIFLSTVCYSMSFLLLNPLFFLLVIFCICNMSSWFFFVSSYSGFGFAISFLISLKQLFRLFNITLWFVHSFCFLWQWFLLCCLSFIVVAFLRWSHKFLWVTQSGVLIAYHLEANKEANWWKVCFILDAGNLQGRGRLLFNGWLSHSCPHWQ